jgi:effector-binding domain-containing protein
MFKYVIASTIAVFAGFAFYVYFYIGGYKSAEFEFTQQPSLVSVVKDHIGAYHKINSVIQEVEAWAKSKNLKCELSLGEYLDNPNLVEEPRLKSRGGCVIADSEKSILQNLEKELPADFKILDLPAREVLMAKFDGSPAIGPWKVYGRLDELLKSARKHTSGAALEIYQILENNKMKTTYYFPVESDSQPNAQPVTQPEQSDSK